MAAKRKRYTVKEKSKIIDKVLSLMTDMACAPACRSVGIAPGLFVTWIFASDTPPDIKETYARNRGLWLEQLANDMVSLCDAELSNADAKQNMAEVQRRRLQIDTRKFLLSKLKPKEYGDKLELTGDKDKPVFTEIKRIIIHE